MQEPLVGNIDIYISAFEQLFGKVFGHGFTVFYLVILYEFNAHNLTFGEHQNSPGAVKSFVVVYLYIIVDSVTTYIAYSFAVSLIVIHSCGHIRGIGRSQKPRVDRTDIVNAAVMNGYVCGVLVACVLNKFVLHYSVVVHKGIAEFNLNSLTLRVELAYAGEFFVGISLVSLGNLYLRLVYGVNALVVRAVFAPEHNVIVRGERRAVPTAFYGV